MVKNAVLILVLACVFLAVGGCGDPSGKFSDEQMSMIQYPTLSGLPAATGGFSISVYDQVITSNKITGERFEDFEPAATKASSFEEFKMIAKPKMQAVVANSIADLLLYQQAKKAMPDNVDDGVLDKFVDEEINRFLASYGGNYSEAEKAIARMDMNWKSFRDYQKRMMIVQSYIAGKVKKDRPLKHSELLDYYNRVKDERFTVAANMQFRLIDIDFKKISQDVDALVKAEDKGSQIADEVFSKLVSGQDFAELAKQYSNGYTAQQGGLWEPVVMGNLASPYDIIEQKAAVMVPGTFSEPIKTDGHIFIIYLISYSPKTVKSFEQVQGQLEQEMAFLQKKKAIDDLIAKTLENVDVAGVDNFVNYCLQEIYNKAAAG